MLLLACGVALAPARADETVTLAKRGFAGQSPAAPFEQFFLDARRLAAATTPAWTTSEGDLSAWGPAVIFPLLGPGVPGATALGLAAPLENEGTVPVLLFRTLGLYAAKSRVGLTDTPTLAAAVARNLATLERAAGNPGALAALKDLAPWGSVGVRAWIAYVLLLHRSYFDLRDSDATRWTAAGLRILREAMASGRVDGGGFRRGAGAEPLALWPTALMIYALVQAYEDEELIEYESEAIAAAAAIETLRADDGAYSAAPDQGEKDGRANAYLAGAFLLLWKNTGDVGYRDRAVAILRWLTAGAGAAAVARDAGLSTHTGYLALLLDSVATQPFENLLGRRPMQLTAELGAEPSKQAIDAMAARLRPADFKYRDMFDGVLRMLLERVPRAGGDIAYDYGDAPGYAAELLLLAGRNEMAKEIIERQAQLLAWPRARDLGEISFGARALLASLDYPDAADGAAAERGLRRYLVLSGIVTMAEGYYLDWLDHLTGGGGFAYGPTVIGAQIAATHLQFAERFPGHTIGWFVDPQRIGREILAAAERHAWDAVRHVYRVRPGTDAVVLLPNAMMIIDLLRAHQLEGEAAYRERAEEVAGGLEVLWDDVRGAYFAGAEQMGENAYQSLSTNSYAALAMLRLHQATQKPWYRARAQRIFDFINRDLYAGGIAYHHLHRGRRAAGDIWCSGCNWRLLSVLSELSRLAGREGSAGSAQR
jgi:hypothetical protein